MSIMVCVSIIHMVIAYIEWDMHIHLIYMCVFVGGLIEWMMFDVKDINTFEFNGRSRSNKELNMHFENLSLNKETEF